MNHRVNVQKRFISSTFLLLNRERLRVSPITIHHTGRAIKK